MYQEQTWKGRAHVFDLSKKPSIHISWSEDGHTICVTIIVKKSSEF
jgi:hypothetical protein